MKSLKLFMIMMLFLLNTSGCEKPVVSTDVCYNYDMLFFVFQDATGNNLIKGIGSNENGVMSFERKRDYLLELVYPKQCMDPYNYIPGFPSTVGNVPLMTPTIVDDYSSLFFHPTSMNKCKRADWITFILNCPYIIGDDTEQEIVTYWNSNKLKRVMFNGKECYFERFNKKNEARITITVNKNSEFLTSAEV